jgi:hypothetical protein
MGYKVVEGVYIHMIWIYLYDPRGGNRLCHHWLINGEYIKRNMNVILNLKPVSPSGKNHRNHSFLLNLRQMPFASLGSPGSMCRLQLHAL